LKHERIRFTNAREEAYRVTTLRPKFGTFSWKSSPFAK